MALTIHAEAQLGHGVLASPLVTINEPACLYFSTGAMNESSLLIVLTSEQIYLGRLSSAHEDWVRVAVELPLGSYYLMFGAHGKHGKVTIADVYLASGECNRTGEVPQGPAMAIATCITHVREARVVMHAGITNYRLPLKSVMGKPVLGIPGACTTRNFTYLVRGPLPLRRPVSISRRPK